MDADVEAGALIARFETKLFIQWKESTLIVTIKVSPVSRLLMAQKLRRGEHVKTRPMSNERKFVQTTVVILWRLPDAPTRRTQVFFGMRIPDGVRPNNLDLCPS